MKCISWIASVLHLEIKDGNAECCEEAIELFIDYARNVINDDGKGLLLFNQVDDLIDEFAVSTDFLLSVKRVIFSNCASQICLLSINSAILCAKNSVEFIYVTKENPNECFSLNL